jgi:hypothetical protein
MEDKHYDKFTMKFTITDKLLRMEISIEDLLFLFHSSPNNSSMYDVELPFAEVKEGREQEFVEDVVKHLMNDAPYEQDDFVWSLPFSQVFEEISESAAEYLKYNDEDDDEED